jgi:hypothetical protein
MIGSREIIARFGLSDPEIVTEFFIRFSYFEFRLMEAGFIFPDKPAWSAEPGDWVRAEVNWSAFEKAAAEKAPGEVAQICKKYLDFMKINPPSVLIVKKNTRRLGWGFPTEEARDISSVEAGYAVAGPFNLPRLSVLLRRIRNNLFHGNKLRDPFDVTVDRLNAGQSILNDFDSLLTAIS